MSSLFFSSEIPRRDRHLFRLYIVQPLRPDFFVHPAWR